MDVILKTFLCVTLLAPPELMSALPGESASVQTSHPHCPAWARPAQPLLLGTDPFLLSASSLAFGILGTGHPTAFGRRHTTSGDKQPVGARGWQQCHAWEMLTGQMGGDRSVLRPETHSVVTSCLAPGGLALRAEPCKLGLKFNSM